MQRLWVLFRPSVILWSSRFFAFTWAYMYHDWQSVVILMWVLHSTFYQRDRTFRLFMCYFYVPWFLAALVWYYVTNIQGMINWPSINEPNNKLYILGFYKMVAPPFETGMMFLTNYLMFLLITVLERDKSFNEKEAFNLTLSQVSLHSTSAFY